jgi:transcriptional regulator with XRE-family HTH domain
MEISVLSVSNGVMKRPLQQPKRQFRKTYIRQWREFRNLTQEQLADRLEMTASFLSMLERGQRGYTQETLEAIAYALQTDVASLLMRDPSDENAVWSIWQQAKPAERKMIVDIAKTITGKTGTEG